MTSYTRASFAKDLVNVVRGKRSENPAAGLTLIASRGWSKASEAGIGLGLRY